MIKKLILLVLLSFVQSNCLAAELKVRSEDAAKLITSYVEPIEQFNNILIILKSIKEKAQAELLIGKARIALDKIETMATKGLVNNPILKEYLFSRGFFNGNVKDSIDSKLEQLVEIRRKILAPVHKASYKAWVASIIGGKPTQEDRWNIKNKDNVSFFAVYDGHGGPEVAEYCEQNMFANITNSAMFPGNIAGAIVQGYLNTDNNLYRDFPAFAKHVGSTAITALIYNGKLYVGNVGDSRAVLSRNGKAVDLSTDHKPDRPDEKARIEKAGGAVIMYGVARVNGILAVSRSIGDKALAPYVIAYPEVTQTSITPDDEFVILASDGVWDVFESQEAVDIVKQYKDFNAAANALANKAYEAGSRDNITVLIVALK